MRTDQNSSLREIMIAVALFLAVEWLDPMGTATSADQVSRDLTHRLTSYCYDSSNRERITTLLIRGTELAAIGSGWPMRLDVYANYLEWIADFEPAAVFLDIGLVENGSMYSLDHDPCNPGRGAPPWLSNFSVVLHDLRCSYRAVADAGPVPQDCVDRDDPAAAAVNGDSRIPLLLGSGNPRFMQWFYDLPPRWGRDGNMPVDRKARVPSDEARTSADFLLPCLNAIGTAVPVRWRAQEAYPLQIVTRERHAAGLAPRCGADHDCEFSAAYLLQRAYCEHARSTQLDLPPGCATDPLANHRQADGGLGPTAPLSMVIDWGRFVREDRGDDNTAPTTSLWSCSDQMREFTLFNYLRKEFLRVEDDDAHLQICPYHKTVPFVFGEPWPNAIDCDTASRDGASEQAGACKQFPDPETLIKGKVVIVGTDIPGYLDRIDTPVHGPYPGPLVHAMALDNLLLFGDGYMRPAYAFGPFNSNDLVEALGLLLFGLTGWQFRRRFLVPPPQPPTRETAAGGGRGWWSRLGSAVAQTGSFLVQRFGRWYDVCDVCVADRADDVTCHNAKVQEMAFKLSLGVMCLVYAAYYVVNGLLNVNPLLDFVLPTIIAVVIQFDALLAVLVGTLSGLARIPAWPLRYRAADAVTRRQQLRRLSQETLPRLALVAALTIALYVFLESQCRQFSSTEIAVLVGIGGVVAFWLADAAVASLRGFAHYAERSAALRDGVAAD
ncbi:MAG: CHASE2 domain-containing protein [Gammaproteobacteria bacterium]|nr:CHASE2 domain-containing protein [Gammaproteobacteria bacterium]